MSVGCVAWLVCIEITASCRAYKDKTREFSCENSIRNLVRNLHKVTKEISLHVHLGINSTVFGFMFNST